MGCFYNLLIFFLSTLNVLIIHLNGFTTAPSIYVSKLCSGDNYTANSTYQANLNLLLSSLSSENTPIRNNRYYYDTVGKNPDTIYGSFQCRGDATSEVCRGCVNTAAQKIIKSDGCPNSKQAIVWYVDCMLRYSNESYFSIMQASPAIFLWDVGNVSKAGQFNQILAILMNDLVTQAVSSGSSSNNNTWFATGEITYSSQQRYGLVQCCSDLSNNSCDACLREAIAKIRRCCDGKGSGRVLLPSCFFRYEMYPFYKLKETEPAPSPPVLPRPPLTDTTITNTKRKNSSKIVVISVIAVFTVLSSTMWYFCLQRRNARKKIDDVDEIQTAETWQFNFNTIRAATDNFSDANELGQGGFGSVYKGTLIDGQEIAVKRLSRYSGQGEEEFKNEVVLVAKLQHRNLVRLLGFCLYGEEKLLIYEFMPNASLDQFIFGYTPILYFKILDHSFITMTNLIYSDFLYILTVIIWLDECVDPIKRTYLDWEKRYKIIGGIARGLLYLHEDSRLRIIHRDLKASNILLGADMTPKISDFGMARMFLMDQTQASTKRIVGTYGYMAPEYAMHGQFSVKSDVFSFGVLVLEILSGHRNNSFCGSEDAQDLLSYAWKHWKEGTTLELLDPTLREHYTTSEVMRCIHIGLLCVQEDVAHRPTMASIVYKLNNYSVALPSPSSPPAFFVDSNHTKTPWTVNEASITELYPR